MNIKQLLVTEKLGTSSYLAFRYLAVLHLIFGSDRSSGNANLRSLVRSVQVCLEQSIFIILAQIFKQSVRNKSAVSEHSESTQRAIREQSESNQSIKIRVIQSEPKILRLVCLCLQPSKNGDSDTLLFVP